MFFVNQLKWFRCRLGIELIFVTFNYDTYNMLPVGIKSIVSASLIFMDSSWMMVVRDVYGGDDTDKAQSLLRHSAHER